MHEIKVIVQTQEEYDREILRNYETQKRFFKFLGRLIIRSILAGFIALIIGILFQSFTIGLYIFPIFMILYLIDLFSKDRKTISYLRAIFGGTYFLIAGNFVLALLYFVVKGISIKDTLFGSVIIIGLFGYLGYSNLKKYTTLFGKKSHS